jgi:sulfate adenylyltransferase subunit 1 (EFTu-like GTPase family)/uncharacterized membrane protein
MAVQYVNRPDSTLRGYCGLVTSGEAYPGMPVEVQPSGQHTRIARIVTSDGDLTHASTGQAVTLVLADDIDVSRGDLVSDCHEPAIVADRFAARLVWIGPEALAAGHSYLLKLAAVTAMATVEQPFTIVDLENNSSGLATCLTANDIGTAVMQLDRLVAVDRYADNPDTGSFILIDSETSDTVALGVVEAVKPSVRRAARNFRLVRSMDTRARSIAKAISWRASGSFDTFVLAALITGNAKVASGVALAEIFTKIALYYVHERVWGLIPWGRR